MTIQHDALVRSLVTHLRSSTDRMVWADMQLGPAGSPRPDAYTIPKSFVRFRPLAYEVKVSRADYHRDVTSGKWQQYLQYACAVTFVVPAGLITKAELPKGCGLMQFRDGVWSTIKAPTLGQIETLPQHVWLKLLIDGVNRAHHDLNQQRINIYDVERALRRDHGDEIAKAFADAAGAKIHFEALAEHYKAELHKAAQEYETGRSKWRQRLADEFAELAQAIGLEPGAQPHQISNRLRKLRDSRSAAQVKYLLGELRRMRRLLDGAIESVQEPEVEPGPFLGGEDVELSKILREEDQQPTL